VAVSVAGQNAVEEGFAKDGLRIGEDTLHLIKNNSCE